MLDQTCTVVTRACNSSNVYNNNIALFTNATMATSIGLAYLREFSFSFFATAAAAVAMTYVRSCVSAQSTVLVRIRCYII